MPKVVPIKPSTVPRKQYNQLWAAAALALRMIEDMEEAGALRLPFIGYHEMVGNLRTAVHGDK